MLDFEGIVVLYFSLSPTKTNEIMNKMHPIDKAARFLNTSLEGLGSVLGVTKGAVSQWKGCGRGVPVIHCVQIEKITNGAVSRRDLRPDDWQQIWPELAFESETV
jgi:hypothetical protein